jgi:hypothetical protein
MINPRGLKPTLRLQRRQRQGRIADRHRGPIILWARGNSYDPGLPAKMALIAD